ATQRRHEVRGRRKLDVDVKSLLQLGDGAQDSVALRNDRQVNIDRVVTPMLKDSARAASKINTSRLPSLGGDGAHERAKPRLIYRFTHRHSRIPPPVRSSPTSGSARYNGSARHRSS